MQTQTAPAVEFEGWRRKFYNVDSAQQGAQKTVAHGQPAQVYIERQKELPGTRVLPGIDAVAEAIRPCTILVGLPFIPKPGKQVVGAHPDGQVQPAGQPGRPPG